MSGDRLARLILFSGYIWGFCLTSTNLAQIVPDSTLGDDSSTLTPGQIADSIENGAIRGETLFHSFEEFNVLSDRQVYFANPNGIEQIITHVTGNNPSNILGRLGVNGSADLFLLNPNGILFGENASLDLGGSFVATTADSLIFDNDAIYSASNPEPPLLNVNIPAGIQFGANAGTITVRGTGHTLGFDSSTLMPTVNVPPSGLKVPTGETIALIGSELNFNSATFSASEGKIELAAIAQSGKVKLEQNNDFWAFDYDEIDNFGKINLFQESLLDVRGGRDLGSVNIRGKDITLSDGSAIVASKSRPGRSKTNGQISFVATNSLNIVNDAANTFPSGVFSQIEQPSNHPGVDIKIEADKLKLQNNALIVSTIINKGRGGNISIDARQVNLIDNYDLPYNTGIYSQSLSGAKGDIGIITVEADNLELADAQEVIFIDDEDDLEDVIGEERAEDLEDFVEDRNVIIGASESGRRSLVFADGGEITSIDRGSKNSGVAALAANTFQFSRISEPEPEIEIPEPEPEIEVPEIEVPEPEPEIEIPEPEPEIEVPEVEPEIEIPESEPEIEVPEVEPEIEVPESEPEIEVPEVEPEIEIPEPEPKVEVPEIEVPEVEPKIEVPEPEPEVEVPEVEPEIEVPEPEPETSNLNYGDRVYVFELSSGQKIVVNAKDLFKAAQSESIDSLTNSSNNSKRKLIEVYADSISSAKTFDPDFDLPSGCRLGNDNFILVGKGGIAENPFSSLIQEITVPDMEPKSTSGSKIVSFTEVKHSSHSNLIVEAQHWKINQSGRVELFAASSQKRIGSLADTPNCLAE